MILSNQKLLEYKIKPFEKPIHYFPDRINFHWFKHFYQQAQDLKWFD